MGRTKRSGRHAAVWLARRLGLDGNPLRRRTDRMEAWLRVCAVAVFLVAAPVAAGVAGHEVDRAGVRAATAQAAHQHSATATLLQSAQPDRNVPWILGTGLAWVEARWPGPRGVPCTGQVLAPLGSPAGSKLTVWINSAGMLASPPARPEAVVADAIAAAVLAPLLPAAALLAGLQLAQCLLHRRRYAAWDAEWLQAEPRWTGRRQ